MRKQILTSVISALLCWMLASLGASGVEEYKTLYQTIPATGGVYLPLIFRQNDPTATSTPIVLATIAATSTATPTPLPTATLTPLPTSRPNCDAAYPTICIPSPPPDLNCGNITQRRFLVLTPDPHNFDSDHDGIGCEVD